MATDVDVQYFSHLNGLTLGNNWGDLIRLLDKALVTGVDFTQITATSIDERGDVHITLYAAHNAMLFQIVELTGFAPTSLNQKYRIKGVPSSNQLILKPALDIAERSIAAIGAGKLASLGYDIIFRDTGDVKRVYRAKNPTAQHPFIRVDETISDGVNSYDSAYAKYAMVGLLEHMNHIDDYENPDLFQLPFNSAEVTKNFKITGTGSTVKRGWSRWYWARNADTLSYANDNSAPGPGNRSFTLTGSLDAFYLQTAVAASTNGSKGKVVNGAGIYDDPDQSTLTHPWFLQSTTVDMAANFNFSFFYSGNSVYPGVLPLSYTENHSRFFALKKSPLGLKLGGVQTKPLLVDFASGASNAYPAGTNSFISIPFGDTDGRIRGTLKHILYSCSKMPGLEATKPVLAGNSMYVTDAAFTVNLGGGFGYYLGEIE